MKFRAGILSVPSFRALKAVPDEFMSPTIHQSGLRCEGLGSVSGLQEWQYLQQRAQVIVSAWELLYVWHWN